MCNVEKICEMSDLCFKNVEKICCELLELRDNGYSITTLSNIIYSKIGKNFTVHRHCNETHCEFVHLVSCINNIYNTYEDIENNTYDQYYLLNLLWTECQYICTE